ncbi:IMS-domain-containing protein [Cylindrobasidium torrendii FP15055 ss-10]|uniref:DNA polymerase kappa n=1 Tax=Cylindrobasidium torrendii FP15055 ss-10 TaxID=1314674 RepID=A0A0D7BV33_9AGAR|nr:IMS-domain-containing protein [Cylindrobasidium torrendii FP15055 ss-10]
MIEDSQPVPSTSASTSKVPNSAASRAPNSSSSRAPNSRAPISSSKEDDPDSLVRRLAGPSAGKAGLATDQSDINRIIAEASKGSKFYENEKRKDKDLTERIDKILKLRDEVTRGVDLAKVEAGVDALLTELEGKRDLSQTIVHVDMDAFYANVELLDNPSLKGKPFGVGHGVLTTASYDARKFGVRSGMAGFIAKKLCPELIFVKNHFARYSEMSKKIMAVFQRYDADMCPMSCDEAYLNVTGYCKEHGITAEECVSEMRAKVEEETKLTVSAGIAPNKMLAKNKPNGQYCLPFEREAIMDFMNKLSIRKIPGIGRVNERLLESIGIKTCGDIYIHRAVVSLMDKQFGLHFLIQTYLGIASNVVQPHAREERKSIGAERTFNTLGDKEKLLQKLEEVAQELEDDMEHSGWTGRTVTLKYKLDTYQVFTRARSCDRWVNKKEELFKLGKELLLPELPLKLRLIGLRVTKLKDLRAEDSVAGIKRFFEPAKAEDEGSNKKRKLDGSPQVHGASAEVLQEAMPGFHEDNDADMVEYPEDDDGAVDEDVFTPASPSKKPKSKAHSSRTSKPALLAEQECPICGKTMEVDNQGLNDHIDFCLSRDVILQAQTEASVEGRPASKRKNKR